MIREDSPLRPTVLAWGILGAIAVAFISVIAAADGAESLAGSVGGDFPAFYGAGSIVADGDLDLLYDLDRQTEAQVELQGDDGGVLYFAYPPPVAVVYAAFAQFGYVAAYVVHTLLMGLAALASWFLIRPMLRMPPPSHVVVAVALTFLPMFMAVTLGQNTALLLLLVVASWRLAADGRQEWAGVMLGLLLFKPQYAVPLIGLHLLRGRFRLVLASAAVGVGWWVTGVGLLGVGWTGDWVSQVSDFTTLDAEVNGGNAVSWLGFWEHLLGVGTAPALIVGGGLAAATALVLAAAWWGRADDDLAVPMAMAGAGILLVSPHAMFYDAGLVAVAVAGLVAGRSAPRPAVEVRFGLRRVIVVGWIVGALHPFNDAFGFTPVAYVVIGAFVLATDVWRRTANTLPPTPVMTQGTAPATPPELSIVIPAFDEAGRIEPTLEALAAWLDLRTGTAEVIVVDDGSADDTADRSMAYAADLPNLRVLQLAENRGKGYAVRVGMLAATGTWRAFLDADGSTDPTELPKLLDPGVTVAIASVAVDGAVLDRAQSGIRSSFGRFGNVVIQNLVLPGIADSQRGCKVLRGDVADAVFAECVIDGWGFDVEVLARARALGHEPLEIGVHWEHRPVGHVRPWHYLTTIAEVIRVRRAVGFQPAPSVPSAHG